MAWRVEVRDPVRHILNARVSSGLNRTEKPTQRRSCARVEPLRKDDPAAANSLEAT